MAGRPTFVLNTFVSFVYSIFLHFHLCYSYISTFVRSYIPSTLHPLSYFCTFVLSSGSIARSSYVRTFVHECMPARAFVHWFSYFRGPGVGKPVAKTQIPSKARLSGAQIDKGARLKELCASAAGEGFGGPCPETFTRSHRRKRSGAFGPKSTKAHVWKIGNP